MVEVIVESADLAGPDGAVPLLLAPMPMARAGLLASLLCAFRRATSFSSTRHASTLAIHSWRDAHARTRASLLRRASQKGHR